MSERRVPIKVEQVDWLCDGCRAPMRCVGSHMDDRVRSFRHVCDCGAVAELPQAYPHREEVLPRER